MAVGVAVGAIGVAVGNAGVAVAVSVGDTAGLVAAARVAVRTCVVGEAVAAGVGGAA
jgi:hypothetical protein